MKKLKNIQYVIQQMYRLTLSTEKQEKLVWKDLKKLHTDGDWPFGTYEKERFIEVSFEISDETHKTFSYNVNDGYCNCSVKILESFPPEVTSELFILATHFNNLLSYGVVTINVGDQYVDYSIKREILIPLLYSAEIHRQLVLHFNMAKDVFWAFQKLVVENEAPVIIIADLLRMNEEKEKKEE